MAEPSLFLSDAVDQAFEACNQGLFDTAEDLCRQVLERDVRDFDALHILSVALAGQNRPLEALASCEGALEVRPDFPFGHFNRGALLHALRRHHDAVGSYDQALALRPNYPEAICNRAVTLIALERLDEALAGFDAAMALRSDYVEAYSNRGVALVALGRIDEALASYEHALAINPDHVPALDGAAECAIKLCDWPRREHYGTLVAEKAGDDRSIITPFLLFGYFDDLELQSRCAKKFALAPSPEANSLPCREPSKVHDRIRLAYLSADYRDHPTAQLIVGVIEAHDRGKFEVTGVSFGPDDGSALRERIAAAFDQFIDVRGQSDVAVAGLLADRQIDLAIDLMGHTQNARPGILAARPAPVQASFLGYPGPLNAAHIDYVIGDSVVTPLEHQPKYSERIVQLPDCYQANDRRRPSAAVIPSRAEAGLPPDGFVFCCFNSVWKIAPPVFDIWMSLLRQVPGSVLWLLAAAPTAVLNLRSEAARRGVDPARLVFGRPLPIAEHLARHSLADLFLDTAPCNAHTTASDALWAGLPVLTCRGQAFSGRVAASLLEAAGLPELVTDNARDYEARALRLATNPRELEGLRGRLAVSRDSCPLFDTNRFARHIERAYETMIQAWRRGEAPESFAVDPI